MRFIDELKLNFTRSEGVFRLMLINISVFLVIGILKLFAFLSGSDFYFLSFAVDKLAMKASFSAFILQPWSVITYMFLHVNFMHILFNMLVLFWTGKIFCDFFNSSKVVAVYLLGGIAGALLYLSAYNIFPAFSNELPLSKLIGASAGVVAVLVAIATLVPDYSVHLLFFGPVRLKYIAIFLVLLYLISIPEGNAGGNIAHIGGALFGFTYTRLLRKGTDTGRWMEKLLNAATGILKPSPKIKVVHKRGQAHSGNSPSQQEVIDAILDKITRSGYSSLTAKEKEILFNASKNKDH